MGTEVLSQFTDVNFRLSGSVCQGYYGFTKNPDKKAFNALNVGVFRGGKLFFLCELGLEFCYNDSLLRHLGFGLFPLSLFLFRKLSIFLCPLNIHIIKINFVFPALVGLPYDLILTLPC